MPRNLNLLLVIACLASLLATRAHLEDYCIYNASFSANGKSSITATTPQNFFLKAAEAKCAFASYRPLCIAEVLAVSGHTFAYESPCRGAIHFDAVYMVASAVGVLPEY